MISTSPIQTGQTQAQPTGKRLSWGRIRAALPGQISAYILLLPALILYGLFAWYPILKSVQMSFYDVQLGGAWTWVGLKNYSLMFRDPAFPIVWRNSLEFALWSLLLGFAAPIILAIFIREVRHAKGFFRIVYFLPTVVPLAVSVIIWRFIYNPDVGLANDLLAKFGIPPQYWLQSVYLAKPSLVAMMTWAGFGTTALIYLASLQDVSQELFEAAELDGANPLQRIRHITLPHLFPVISIMFVLQVITVVQVFTEPFLLTQGGPGRETLTPAMHIYNRAFFRYDLGYASTWSVAMIVVLGTFSIMYQYVNRRLSRML